MALLGGNWITTSFQRKALGGFSPIFCHLWAPVAEVAVVTVVEVAEVVEVAGVTLLASSSTTVVRLFGPKSTFATADISAAAPSLCIFTWTAGVGVEVVER